MLRRRGRVLACVAVLLFLEGQGQAAFADTTSCPPGYVWNRGFCVLDPNDPDNPNDPNDPDPPTTGCNQSEPALSNIPCRISDFQFSADLDRYLSPLPAADGERYRPPDGELSGLGVWTGPPDEGWIYDWRKLAAVWGVGNYAWGARGLMWLPAPPVAPTVDPEDVAEDILVEMDLQPIEIGTAPTSIEKSPDAVGLVGAPIWMWAVDPGPQTWGPITASDSAGGLTVTVTAQVDDAGWSMGDGGSKSCTSPGDAYKEAYGVRSSPSCGYVYERTSRDEPDQAYTITATTNWSATWESSTGETGTLDVEPLTSTGHVRIGERQLIEQ